MVNVCKQKHVTNIRNAASSEDSLRLVAVHPMTLEECLEFIGDDELLEVTPDTLRMRKRELSHEQRARALSRSKKHVTNSASMPVLWYNFHNPVREEDLHDENAGLARLCAGFYAWSFPP